MHLVREQSRLVPRQNFAKEIPAIIGVGGQTYQGALVNYSLRGFGLSVEPGLLKRAQRDGWNVEIGVAEGRFRGVVKHSRLENHRAWLGVHLQGPVEAERASFTHEDPDWDLIEDAETIENLLTDMLYKGPQVLVELKQLGVLAEAFVTGYDHGDTLSLEMFSERKGSLTPGRTKVTFEIFQTCHAFETSLLEVVEKRVVLKVPQQVARLLRRETVRVRNGEQGQVLQVKLASSLLGQAPTEIELYDFSEHGISILEPSGWSLAPAGIPFEHIVVTTPDGMSIEGSGTVRGHRWLPEKETYVIGINFETSSYEDRTRWHNAILEARYPRLSFQYSDTDHSEIWSLFDRSGYLKLKPAESFSHIVDVTKHTWKRLCSAGTGLSKRLQIRADGVVGHLQLDRIYPKTWCAHALAIDPKVSKIVGKEIYAATTDILSAEGAKYLYTVTTASLTWNQKNYYNFVKNYRFPEHNFLRLLQMHEADTAKGWDLERSPVLDCRIANKFDLRRIARYYELYASALEREAMGLTFEELTLESLDHELRPHGLSRRREFIVGLKNGQLMGFAVMETGSLGLSVFGIQDSLFVHVLPEVGMEREAIYETLMFEALNHYRSMEIPTVSVYMIEDRKSILEKKGLPFIGEEMQWIADCVAGRRYHAFSQMLYGHLLLKRERIHKKSSD